MAMPCATSFSGGVPVMSRPSKITRPLFGLTAPMMAMSVLDLPAPFAPSSAVISPGRTSSDTSCTACTPPYDTCRPSILSIGSDTVFSPQIGFDHGRVAHDLGRRPLGDHLPEIQHQHALGQAHHHLEHVLDDDQRHALGMDAAQYLRQSDGLGGIQTARHFVE